MKIEVRFRDVEASEALQRGPNTSPSLAERRFVLTEHHELAQWLRSWNDAWIDLLRSRGTLTRHSEPDRSDSVVRTPCTGP